MYDYERASDGDGNWVELHGLTSIFGMDYGFMRLDCVQSRFFPLPCLALLMCSHFDPQFARNVTHSRIHPGRMTALPRSSKII